jgi:hypothetical protein
LDLSPRRAVCWTADVIQKFTAEIGAFRRRELSLLLLMFSYEKSR